MPPEDAQEKARLRVVRTRELRRGRQVVRGARRREHPLLHTVASQLRHVPCGVSAAVAEAGLMS
jgi:hypothetical protein